MFTVHLNREDLTLEILRNMQGLSCEQLLAEFPADYKLFRYKNGAQVKNSDNHQVAWGHCPEMALRMMLLSSDTQIEVSVKHLPVTLALIERFKEQLAVELEPVEVFVDSAGQFLVLGEASREFGSRLKRAFPQIQLWNAGYYTMDVDVWASRFDIEFFVLVTNPVAPDDFDSYGGQ